MTDDPEDRSPKDREFALQAANRMLRERQESAHTRLVNLAAEIRWATDGQLETGVRHVEELVRRLKSRIADLEEMIPSTTEEWGAEIVISGQESVIRREASKAAAEGWVSSPKTESRLVHRWVSGWERVDD